MRRKALMIVLALAAAPVLAAPYGGGPRQAGPPMQALTEALELRPEQATMVEQILQNHRQARMEERQRARQALRDELATVLEPEQLTKLEAFQKGKAMGRRGQAQRHGYPGRYQRTQ